MQEDISGQKEKTNHNFAFAVYVRFAAIFLVGLAGFVLIQVYEPVLAGPFFLLTWAILVALQVYSVNKIDHVKEDEQQKLALYKTTLNILEESSNTGVWIYSVESQSLKLDMFLLNCFGITDLAILSDARAQSIFWQEHIHPDDYQTTRDFISHVQNRLPGDCVKIFRMKHAGGIKLMEARYCEHSSVGLLNGKTVIIGTIADVTERENSKNSAADERSRYFSLISNLPGVIFRCSDKVKWVPDFISEACVNMSGYTPEEFRGIGGVNLSEIIVPEWRQHHVNAWREAAVSGGKMIDEFQFRTKSGELRWAVEYGEILFDSNNEPASYEAFILDCTDRKNAEKKLIESNRRYATLISNLPGVAFRSKLDDERTLEFISRKSTELTGYTSEELLQGEDKSLLSLLSPEDLVSLRAAELKAISLHTKLSLEYRIITKFGDIKYVLEQSEIIRDDYGTPVAVEGLITDITRQKEAELALKKSQMILETVVNNLPFALWGRDHDMVCFVENTMSVEIWGSMLNKVPNEHYISKDAEVQWRADYAEVLKGKKIDTVTTIADKNGTMRTFRHVLTPIVKDDKIIGVLGLNMEQKP